mgnify:FL=1
MSHVASLTLLRTMHITLMEPYDLIFGTVRPVSAVFVDDKDC